jgi:hypothetical protein
MRNYQEAAQRFEHDAIRMEAIGIYLREGGARAYIPDGFRNDAKMALDAAMDAQPQLSTDPNSAVMAMLTTYIDPVAYKVLFSPNRAAQIYGEVRKGDWLMDTAAFPIVEHTGEVSSYGDYAENGSAGVNSNFPQRQNYIFQTIKQYGDREAARAGLAKLNWVSEVDQAAVTVMDKFSNYSYFFGIKGLQSYGGLTDPNLSAPLTPAPKVAGGTAWVQSGVIVATANEIYLDIETVFIQLVAQSGGLVDRESKMTLALSPQSEAALTATNSFAVNVSALLKLNFPNMRVISATQFGVISSSNPQGIAAGNLMQLIAGDIEGQETGFAAYSDKLRSQPIIRLLSAFKQKVLAGTWGTVFRQTFGISQMVGI